MQNPRASELAERYRASGLRVRIPSVFSEDGVTVFSEFADAGGARVVERCVHVYPGRRGGLELRVTRHGGPHWIRHVGGSDEAECVVRAHLAGDGPPGDGWQSV